MRSSIGACFLSMMLASFCWAQSLTAVNLTVQGRLNPVGIGQSQPALGWGVQSSEPAMRGQAQSAYEIRVASSPALLEQGKADLWDSGKSAGQRNNGIIYAGRPIGSAQQCWWAVRLWNKNGEGGLWSRPGCWSAGLLSRSDWKAKWIGLDAQTLGHEPPAQLVGCQWIWTNQPTDANNAATGIFRGGVDVPVDRVMRKAMLSIAAAGRFEAWVNGYPVLRGDNVRTLFSRDISPWLQPGKNCIAISVRSSGKLRGVAGRVEMRFDKGKPIVVNLDQTWKADSKLSMAAMQRRFDDSAWKMATALAPVGRGQWGVPTEAAQSMDPAIYLRHMFLIEKPVKRAVLYATAMGNYQLRLDAQKLGQNELMPGFSDYRKRVFYNSYDVTPLLHLGHNVLAAVLSDGWYAGYWPQRDRTHNYGGDPRFLAQLEIEYADGTTQCIATDKSWKASLGPIRQADIHRGSIYDARQDLGSWDYPLYNDSGWRQPAVGLNGPEPLIQAFPGAPAQSQEVLTPRRIYQPAPAFYVLDFGRQISGHLRLHARGHAGDGVEIYYATDLDPNDPPNLRRLSHGGMDFYVFKDNRPVTWEPSFTRHTFRYAVIGGLARKPGPATVQAVAVNADMPQIGWFTCSNRRLNHLFNQSLQAQRNASIGKPMIQRPNLLVFDSSGFYAQWLLNVNDLAAISQGGVITASSPLDHDQQPVVTRDIEPVVLADLWQAYGDTRAVRRNYAQLSAYLDDLKNHWQTYANEQRYLSDWPAKNSQADAELVALAQTAHVAELSSQMAAAIDQTPDAEIDHQLHDELVEQFRARLHQASDSIKSPTVRILALAYNLVPDNQRLAMENRLINQLHEDNWRSAVGCLGLSQLLPVLSNAGHTNLALQIIQQDDDPCLAADQWLMQTIGGIHSDAVTTSPIQIAPQLVDQLSFARTVYNSPIGAVQCQWHADQDSIHMSVTIPISADAMVHVPTSDPDSVRESGRAAGTARDISYIGYENHAAVYLVGSGHYAFTASR